MRHRMRFRSCPSGGGFFVQTQPPFHKELRFLIFHSLNIRIKFDFVLDRILLKSNFRIAAQMRGGNEIKSVWYQKCCQIGWISCSHWAQLNARLLLTSYALHTYARESFMLNVGYYFVSGVGARGRGDSCLPALESALLVYGFSRIPEGGVYLDPAWS